MNAIFKMVLYSKIIGYLLGSLIFLVIIRNIYMLRMLSSAPDIYAERISIDKQNQVKFEVLLNENNTPTHNRIRGGDYQDNSSSRIRPLTDESEISLIGELLAERFMNDESNFKQLKPSATIGFEPKSILFIHTNEDSNASLVSILQRYCKYKHLKVAIPTDSFLQTCDRLVALKNWDDMAKKNNGTFDAWLSHSCYQRFMDTNHQQKYWRYPRSQIKLAMINEPFQRVYNSYKKYQDLCEEEPELETIDRELCNKTIEEYLEPQEIDYPYNEQVQYITGFTPEHFSILDAHQFMSYAYNMVLLSGRFDESLAVLYIRFGFPWKIIPYIDFNQNLESSISDVSNSTRDYIYEKMKYEKGLYDAASKQLDSHIAAIGQETFLSILKLLKETNKRIYDECKVKERGDCIFHDPYRQIGESCLHECIEEVSKALVKEIIVKELASPKDSTLLKIMRYKDG